MPGIEKIATGILRFGERNFTLDIRELVIFPSLGKMAASVVRFPAR